MKPMAARFPLLLVMIATPALCAESGADPAAAYRAVLQAQYGARQPAPPARPEEAQKIYDAYLQSMGQPGKSHTGTTNASTHPR
jgi:hypothetical protein